MSSAKPQAHSQVKKAKTLSQAMAKQAARPGTYTPGAPAANIGRAAPVAKHAFTFHGAQGSAAPAPGGAGRVSPRPERPERPELPRAATAGSNAAPAFAAPNAPASPTSPQAAPTPRRSILKSAISNASLGGSGPFSAARPRVSLPDEDAAPPASPQRPRGQTASSQGGREASPPRPRAQTARSPPPRGAQSSGQGSPLKATTAPHLDSSPAGNSTQSTASPTSPWIRRLPSSRNKTVDPYQDSEEPDLIAVGNGMKSKKTLASNVAAPAPALGPKNSFFGTGERMEPTKWKRWANMVDKQTLGAHYQYIVGELSAAHALDDAGRREHDEVMADSLQRKRPEEPAHPLAGSPKPPAATAFTDRAMRLRNAGRDARAVLSPQDDAAPPSARGGGCRGDCSCPVCCPETAHAAGQPSHDVHHNRVPRCAKDGAPSVPAWEPSRSLTLHSYGLARSLPHLQGNPAELPAQEEQAFHQNFGRKAKGPVAVSPGHGSMLLHKSFSVDDIHNRSAGNFNQELAAEISMERSLRRQPWQASVGELRERHGAAFVLDPLDSDPPAPTQICSNRKAPGNFKHDFTDQSKYSTTYFNQAVHRFADAGVPRGRSQPPPRPDRSTAGVATGEWGNHMWNHGDPVTMQGKDKTPRALGNTGRPRGDLTHRANLGNRSDLISRTINQDVCNDYFAMETNWRMHNERDFSALCTLTQDSADFGKTLAQTIKHRNGHADSSYIRQNLQWPGA